MKHLSSSLLEIMMAIWAMDCPVSRNEVKEKVKHKEWKVTTFNTFLNRLVLHGFLKREDRGREYVYSPLITKEEYLKYEGEAILKTLYGGSVRNFMASMYQGGNLSENDLEEIQAYLQMLKKE